MWSVCWSCEEGPSAPQVQACLSDGGRDPEGSNNVSSCTQREKFTSRLWHLQGHKEPRLDSSTPLPYPSLASSGQLVPCTHSVPSFSSFYSIYFLTSPVLASIPCLQCCWSFQTLLFTLLVRLLQCANWGVNSFQKHFRVLDSIKGQVQTPQRDVKDHVT